MGMGRGKSREERDGLFFFFYARRIDRRGNLRYNGDVMNVARAKVFAKLNLSLDLVGREGEYHLLDSLVCSVNLFDTVTARRRKDGEFTVTMKGMGSEAIPPEKNNAYRAAVAFQREFSTTGADIVIHKNIPMNAGLGGSSADAAGVINALSDLYGINDLAARKRLADSLGSDTGYLLTGGFARLRGRGERIEPLGKFGRLYFLLLCPETGVSTAECYREYDRMGLNEAKNTEAAVHALVAGAAALGVNLKNALYKAAASLNPDVREALAAAWSFSPLGACMTGSGSGVFALMESEEMCAYALSRYRGGCKAYSIHSVE